MANTKQKQFSQKVEKIIQEEYEDISLLRNPILTLKTLSIIITEQLIRFIKLIISHKLLMLIFFIYICLNFIEGPHLAVI